MITLKELNKHSFIKLLLSDAMIITKDRGINLREIYLSEDIQFEEWEYHIHTVGFYTMNLIHLCTQLDSATSFISNYNYTKSKSTAKRIDHLEYNVENYIIRVGSVRDRVLQVINAVFHLCIDERNVSNEIILNNLKVKQSSVPKLVLKVNSTVKRFSGDRNTIIHHHTYMNTEIRKLHIFYSDLVMGLNLEKNMKDDLFKDFRKQMLTKYLRNKKKEMNEANAQIYLGIFNLFTELEKYYVRQKSFFNRNIK